MNERIKQLAEQAKDFMTDQVSYLSSIHNRALSTTEAADIFEEKFAQLIVKECVGIVAKRKDQAIDDDCNVDEAMTMAEMDLLDNFGVEE
jgi:hypothetical protein